MDITITWVASRRDSFPSFVQQLILGQSSVRDLVAQTIDPASPTTVVSIRVQGKSAARLEVTMPHDQGPGESDMD